MIIRGILLNAYYQKGKNEVINNPGSYFDSGNDLTVTGTVNTTNKTVTIDQSIPNAYYENKKMLGTIDATAIYNAGYNAGLSNSSASAYKITIKTDGITLLPNVPPNGSYSNAAIWTAYASGNLRTNFASGYYIHEDDGKNHWYAVPWVSLAIYNKNGGLKYTQMSVAGDGVSCKNGPIHSWNLEKGDYIVLSGTNPSPNNYANAYMYGTFSYAVVN